MSVKYALLREGSTDAALQIIVERYGASKGISLVLDEGLSKPFNGPLGDQLIRIRTRSNFDSDAVQIAFYFTDKDKDDFSKEEKIKHAIKSVNETYILRSIIGIPDPHMEAWFLADQDAVKRVFGLAGDQPIPYETESPKKRLELLANNHGNDELTPPEARKRLAQELDLSVAERTSPSFRHFIRNYNAYINTASR